MANADRFRNHLADQSAAYLVQHARDPVDWRPWGQAAFDDARERGAPIFLSLGYASCHWCHVMQRESFRDEKTARYLNEKFVSIKVDRDERPDIDHLYQQYVTMAAGSSGWPMSVFIDAARRPFYGGTYYPKTASYNMQSLAAVLSGVDGTFQGEPERIAEVADESTMVLADLQAPNPTPVADRAALGRVVEGILELEDPEWGGLGDQPKFPSLPILQLLLAHHEAWGDKSALEVAERWMYAMLRGGIYDQVGGGLFRYATDRQWRLPHFEKMLVDNALLLSAIAALYRLAPTEELARAARGTGRFLARDLARSEGGYWISTDSESEGLDGGAYTWTGEQFASTLDAAQLEVVREFLDADYDGTPTRRFMLGRPAGRIERADEVDAVLAVLLDARASRPIRAIRNAVTEANALAARGLIEAGNALGDDELVSQGVAVVDWLLAETVRDRRVVHMVGDPAVGELDLLGDYAALAAACVASGRMPGRQADEETARTLLERAFELFEDHGVLYMTRADTDLPVRPAAYDDVPVASGWVTALDAHWALNPDDVTRVEELLGPLLAFAFHAPAMAGATLALATRLTAARVATAPK